MKILSCVCRVLYTVGASGNVLINRDADRVYSFNVWNYAEGDDSYRSALLVDLTQPPGEASI